MPRLLSCPDCRTISELTTSEGTASCPECGSARALMRWVPAPRVES